MFYITAVYMLEIYFFPLIYCFDMEFPEFDDIAADLT